MKRANEHEVFSLNMLALTLRSEILDALGLAQGALNGAGFAHPYGDADAGMDFDVLCQ